MKRALLRRPRGTEIIADIVRALSAISIVFSIGLGLGPALSTALATLAMFLPRMLGVRPFLDVAFCIVTGMATWSAVLDVYETVLWWDIPMHFALNALIAALGYVFFVRVRVFAGAAALPRPVLSATVVTTAIGLSFGVLWELLEWFMKSFIDGGTLVGYEDTLGDLVAGGLGSLVAGLSMQFLASRSPDNVAVVATAAGGDRRES